MKSWSSEHGICGSINENICSAILTDTAEFPSPYDVPVGGKAMKVGNCWVTLEQSDFYSHEENNPGIVARLFYIDNCNVEQTAIEVFAPFRDPDTGDERGWAVVVRESYTELVEAAKNTIR